MSELESLIQQIGTTDTRTKIQIGNDIANILNSSASFECEDVGLFVDGLVPWLHNSNFKVVLNGLDVMYLLVQKLGKGFLPYVTSVIPPTIDRLGDSKDVVREKSQLLLKGLMVCVISPNQLFEKITPAFSHKNSKVREEAMNCLQNTLNNHGASSITISRLMPHLVKLLSDPTATVRDCAFNTIVETYKHYGERLRIDLEKKFNIPQTKLPSLLLRCDEVRDSGLVIASPHETGKGDDETDKSSVKSNGSKSRASSAPPVRRAMPGSVAAKPSGGTINENGATDSTSGTLKRTTSLRRKPSLHGGTAAGAMDENAFFSAFEDVPKITLYSARDMESTMNKIKECIQNTQNEWDKRIEALKKIRSVMLSGGLEYEEFYAQVRLLEPAMQVSIKDLRSQVVREACITVAYMSQEMQGKLDHFCEMVLLNLINLIPNTVKVMASAAVVCIRFIIQNTHHHKLVPIFTRELANKSKEIRKTVLEFLDQLVHSWPSYTMEKHVSALAEAIKKGISDADPEARAYARKAYWGFADHYKEEADRLLTTLDPSYRRMLQVEHNGGSSQPASASSSRPASRPWSRASSAAGSTENLAAASTGHGASRRWGGSGLPPSSRPPLFSAKTPSSFRSNSAIDIQAVRRSQARAQYAHQNRMKAGSGVSLPRPRKVPDQLPPMVGPDRTARSRTKGCVSQSQPGSRSGSPSSRLSYATYAGAYDSSGTLGRGRPTRPSGIPRSTGTSRDPSPNRYGSPGFATPKSRARSISGSCDMPPQIPTPRPRQVMAHKILQQSREAESALADALVSLPPNLQSIRTPNRRHYGTRSEDHSDNESETSSICSDRSFDSYRKNEFVRYSPKQRVLKEAWDNQALPVEVNEIILFCASTHWKDRKEGLAALHAHLMSGKTLSRSHLRRVTDILTKMFVDTTTKAYSLFLETVTAVVAVHAADLQDWLPVLLKRLLNKLGGDLLGSVQAKIHSTLDLVRDSFKCELQFQALMRFLTDPTQTPTPKVKVASLTYLKCLVDVMDGDGLLCTPDAVPGVAKVLAWTSDPKSVEVRRAASAAFVAMFNCSMNNLMSLVQQLPQPCQETASQLIQNHLRRAASLDAASPSSLPSRGSPSVGGTPPSAFRSPGGTPTYLQSPGGPYLQSPGAFQPRMYHSRTPRFHGVDLDDTENLNPEDVSRNLKRTMDEIRNYSFELDASHETGRDSLGKQRDSTSQDSGISQLSLGGGCGPDATDHNVSDIVNGLAGMSLSGLSSPTHRNLLSESNNGHETLPEDDFNPKGDENSDSDHQLMSSIISELGQPEEENDRDMNKHAALTNLARLAQSGSAVVWNEKFRMVLRVLLDTMNSEITSTKVAVLIALTEMIKRCSLVQHFLNFSELVILRVLKANGDRNLEVTRAAQLCLSTMAEVLPPDVVVRIVKPLVFLAEFPINQAAIKMLNKLVEAHPASVAASILPEVMPALIRAYDNKDSSVRKAAVFCMVALHSAVGEDMMRPYLESLTGSKLRLVNLYIERAHEKNSGASSPKPEAHV